MEVWPQVMVEWLLPVSVVPGRSEQHHSGRQTFTAMMVSFLMDYFPIAHWFRKSLLVRAHTNRSTSCEPLIHGSLAARNSALVAAGKSAIMTCAAKGRHTRVEHPLARAIVTVPFVIFSSLP